MSTATELALEIDNASPDAVLDVLDRALISQKDFHRLFDARLIRARRRMGLPLTQPTSLTGIPREQDAAFREAYTQPVREAIEKLVAESNNTPGPQLDELLNLALYEGAHTVEGIRLLLRTHGTCNTVTAMSQVIGQITPDERRRAAAIMVAHLYKDLQASVGRDLERREIPIDPATSLREMITGREFLFAEGNYHIDVSHLHSIVGFARHLQREDPDLQLAVEMSLYGQQLSEHLRYPADVPFDDYYRASENFLSAVAGNDVSASLQWFVDRLHQEPDESDRRMIAFVIVDLAQRVGRLAEALEIAAPWLSRMEDPNGFSFTACCVEAGRLDLLEKVARDNGDLLALATLRLVKVG